MQKVFVDTNFWVAKIHRDDQWHEAAIEAEYNIGIAELVTTEAILIETLNYFSSFRKSIKKGAASVVRSILESPEISVIVLTIDDLKRAIKLYEERTDQRYSLTDCTSMVVMRDLSISRVLTHDQHFIQEGFRTLL